MLRTLSLILILGVVPTAERLPLSTLPCKCLDNGICGCENNCICVDNWYVETEKELADIRKEVKHIREKKIPQIPSFQYYYTPVYYPVRRFVSPVYCSPGG